MIDAVSFAVSTALMLVGLATVGGIAALWVGGYFE